MTSVGGAAATAAKGDLACSTGSASSRNRASTAGWCRRRRCASTSASAWRMASRCSGSRCKARCQAPTAKRLPECSAGAITFGEKAAGTLKALFATDCNWSQFDLGWMYTFFFVLLGVSAAIWGGWLERAGPRKAGLVSTLCWCGGLLISALGVDIASALDALARLGHHRRHWPRPRLHLARLDAHQVVPGPARHGDRHGHHGLRRRRHDRLAARDPAHVPLQDADRSRRRTDLHRHGRRSTTCSC